MKSFLKKVLTVMVAFSLLQSCTEDYFEFDEIVTDDWRPELALPLINSSLSLADIVTTNDTNGIIQKGENEILQVVYDGRVFSTRGAAVVTLADQPVIRDSYSSPNPLPTNGGTVERDVSTTINFDAGANVEIDSLLMKSGVLDLTIENTFQHNVIVVAKFPAFKKPNGQILELSYDIPASTNGNIVTRGTGLDGEDLTDYTIDMTAGGTTVNEIPIEFDLTFNLVNGNSSVPSDELAFSIQLSELSFKEFHGYLGNTTLPLDQDTIKVNLFRNFLDAKFFLSNPLLEITVLNSFGLPVDLNFNQLFAVNPEETPTDKQVQLPPSKTPLTLNYPFGLGSDTTLLSLDTNNSNIDEIISFLLEQLVYNATANFNPGNDRNIRNFLTDTSSIGLDVFLRIPFSGYATGFTVEDTIDFEFENSDDIDEGLVRVRVNNGFPIGGNLQIFFLDQAYDTLEVLFVNEEGIPTPQKVIDAAPVDGVGNVTSPKATVTDGTLNRQRLANLKNSKYALVRATMETDDAQNGKIVSFREGYKIDVAVGIKAKFLID